MHGIDSLPFVDFIDVDEIDLLLITHFHLDHCGALPWLLTKTAFRGRCFMTHATKAIYRIMLGDFVKVAKNGPGGDRILYTEDDVEKSMSKIECVDFKEQKEVNGVRFRAYVAGHVLGACMFMIEIDTVRILYTGDFSCEEDRHLRAAEVPEVTPDILISVIPLFLKFLHLNICILFRNPLTVLKFMKVAKFVNKDSRIQLRKL